MEQVTLITSLDEKIGALYKEYFMGANPEEDEDIEEVAGMQITSLSYEMRKAANRTVTEWLVPGVIVRGGYTLLYAPHKSGKSWGTIDLAVAVSHSEDGQYKSPIGV